MAQNQQFYHINGTLVKQVSFFYFKQRILRTVLNGQKCIMKERFFKKYRHPDLEARLTRQRITGEVRNMVKCRRLGLDVPVIYMVDTIRNSIFMEFIDGVTLKEWMFMRDIEHDAQCLSGLAHIIGIRIAEMHDSNILHGDLTTSNIMLRKDTNSVVFIDFGLSFSSFLAEEKAVDLYVLERAFISTHPNSENVFATILKGYSEASKNGTQTIRRLNAVRLRGRKRAMVG